MPHRHTSNRPAPPSRLGDRSRGRGRICGGRWRAVWAGGLTAALLIVGAGCGGGQSVTTTKPAGSSTATVTVFTPTAADLTGVEDAIMAWTALPSTCRAVAISTGLRFATTRSTGVSWATARFTPGPGCKIFSAPGRGGQPMPLINPYRTDTFQLGSDGLTGLAVFERPANGTWTMNEFGTTPFPCPGIGGVAPGSGNSALPPQVLTAWNLPYAANCSSASYAPQQGH